MPGVFRSLALAAGLCSSLLHTASAYVSPHAEPVDLVSRQASSNDSAAATYIYKNEGDDSANFTFTISVNPDNDDLWFRMQAPAQYSWISVAAGTQMSKAKVFFMAYRGGHSSDEITLSARGACDDCEPAYMQDFPLRLERPNDANPYGVTSDGIYNVAGSVPAGAKLCGINPDLDQQPFMFAVGPQGKSPYSSEPDAPLRMHAFHGNFQLDMTMAHGTEMPELGKQSAGVKAQGTVTTDKERASTVHAVIMIFSFLIFLPVGVVMLRLLKKVKLHMYVMGAGLLAVTVGWVMGFVISGKYQRSMHFNSAHQIIGIVVYLLLLVQFTTGFAHHRIWLRTQQPTFFIKPHKYGLGALVIGGGIVNNAIGFRFALSQQWNMIYVPVVIAASILLMLTVFIRRVMAKRREKSNRMFGGPAPPPPVNYRAPSGSAVGGGATVSSSWSDRPSEVELSKMGPPPAYSGQPTKPTQFV